MAKIYDLVVKVGEYQKDGQTKAKNKNIGVVMQNDKGMYIIMDRTFNPAGVPNPDNKESFFISMYEAKSETTPSQHTVDKGNAYQVDSFDDSEIPL